MPKIAVKRFIQEARNQCAVGAVTCLSHYYDNSIDFKFVYDTAKSLFKKELDNGLYSHQMGILLNKIGFKNVSIVTGDPEFIDYSWAGYSKSKLIDTLRDQGKIRGEKQFYNSLVEFLSDKDSDNKIIIDWNFAERIRESIDIGVPVIGSFNWTMFFKQARQDDSGDYDAINGEYSEHAVVINGYDKKSASIVDSHIADYKYKLKGFRSGLYNIEWEHLMTVMGRGDVLIPHKYCIGK